ncbi:hypothetical protein [Desulfovibrio cuneatus]|nr:hypothetical protein [Desulfovibrio cuneatus]
MHKLLWFLAGAVASYIASGYVEGLVEDDSKEEPRQAQGKEKAQGAKA